MKRAMIFQRSVLVEIVVIVLILTVGSCSGLAAGASRYKSAVLMSVETGQILFEENAHQDAIPASIVKMMVLLLTLEHVEAGTVSLDDIVTVSAWASKIGGSQVYLAEGEQFRLEELLKAIAISSANDAATAVAEYIGGDVDAFVEMMNARAEELGMNDTVFANEHGLPPGKGQKDNVTSAFDIAILGKELLQFPQILQWSSTVEDTFRNGTFTLTNTNRELLQKFPGADGLKTGFHSHGAGFNVCATAKRDERRLIAVVMGAERKADRYNAAVSLFNRGFNQYKRVVVIRKGFTVGDPLMIRRGKDRTTSLVASEDVVVLVTKNEEQEISQNVNIPLSYMIAPVKQGMRFGEVEVSIGDQVVARVDLVTETDIRKGNPLERMKWWLVNKIF
ncbi:D-alanyl-D-alanine carboxypeptidase [candidate division KSB3 bacterium]|uniref:serine-type D-Ala-D-Ala carboxypeptidase n=1 Tax=candidate division KSB3 bacterium TaxID=2044937 RepID=A0A2G6E5H4_9BACT|nr:MAG: D-alanyl-D-alanine carboxypeptidase [candidate division KSB3 bacterium]PIE29655.1 MAG: D-alanyl-D-alanine carboxypeptidase [candidate division KSB3 bacterium]